MRRKGSLFGRKSGAGGRYWADSPEMPKINMTPMIDCTFLLIIFFMLVSEMASRELEEIALPHADQARGGGDGVGNPRLIINIRKNDAKKGTVRIQGRDYDREKLVELISKEAIRSGREYDPDYPNVAVHKLDVRVRCDRDAKYETVQWVLDACARNGVYRTKLAASPETE